MSGKKSTVVVVDRTLLSSRAYHDLSGTAAKVLMWFLAKRRMTKLKSHKREPWIVANNGEITFTYKEAKSKHGLNPQAFSKAIDELVAKGFIDVERPGTGVGKVPTQFAISERWRGYGTTEFVIVKRWKRAGHRFPSGRDHPKYRKREQR